jgi:hypothetical protein
MAAAASRFERTADAKNGKPCSHVHGEGHGDQHAWVKIETMQAQRREIVNNVVTCERLPSRLKHSKYYCSVCGVKFVHYYDLGGGDIFSDMKTANVPIECDAAVKPASEIFQFLAAVSAEYPGNCPSPFTLATFNAHRIRTLRSALCIAKADLYQMGIAIGDAVWFVEERHAIVERLRRQMLEDDLTTIFAEANRERITRDAAVAGAAGAAATDSAVAAASTEEVHSGPIIWICQSSKGCKCGRLHAFELEEKMERERKALEVRKAAPAGVAGAAAAAAGTGAGSDKK